MKICVISDSHGNKGKVQKVINQNSFDYLFFLGDGIRDLEVLDDLENIKTKIVSGNCDLFADQALTQIFSLNNVKIMITHGHQFKVKLGTSNLFEYAKQHGISLVCYGHTHQKSLQMKDGVTLLNPGALKNNEYAIIYLDGKGIGIDFFNL